MEAFARAHEDAIEAWNGPLFDRFVQFRHIVTTGLGAHGEAALAACPPPLGARVLDIRLRLRRHRAAPRRDRRLVRARVDLDRHRAGAGTGGRGFPTFCAT